MTCSDQSSGRAKTINYIIPCTTVMYPLLEIVAHMIMAVAIVCCVASGVKVQWKGDISLRLYPTSVEKLKPL